MVVFSDREKEHTSPDNNAIEGKKHSIYSGAVAPVENMTARDWAAREIYTSELQYCGHLETLVVVRFQKKKLTL